MEQSMQLIKEVSDGYEGVTETDNLGHEADAES
jgi:hypothetical protein